MTALAGVPTTSDTKKWLPVLIAVVIGAVFAGPADAVFAGPADASRSSKRAVRLSVTTHRSKLAVRVRTMPRSTCSLRVSARRKSVRFPKVVTGVRGLAAFTWTVPANAPGGRWKFTVSCRKGGKTRRATRRALILTRGNGTGELIEPSSGTLRGARLASDGRGAGSGQSCAPDVDGRQVCFTDNPFASYGATGECTWYAAGRRPDLYGIARHNANQWPRDVAGRVPTGTFPVVGAVAVWNGGGGGAGHVAYVTAVLDGGATVVVDESNFVRYHTVSYRRRVPAGEISSYIYGGPAGNPRAGSPGGGSEPTSGVGTRLLADVTGDGRSDAVVMFRDSGVAMVAAAQPGGGFGGPAQWSYGHSVGASRYFAADATGDGKADLIAFFGDQGVWKVSASSGTGFWEPTDWAYGHAVGTSRQWVADATGDSKADVITFDAGTGDWYVSASDGHGFQTFSRWITGHGVGSQDQAVGDANGDGKADAGVWTSDGRWHTASSTGNYFGYPGEWSYGHGVGTDQRLWGDANGDGKADEAFFHASDGRWYVGTSTGSGFNTPSEWAFGHGVGTTERFLGDVDGDHRADVVTFDDANGDWWVSSSSGSGFWPPQRWATGHGAHS